MKASRHLSTHTRAPDTTLQLSVHIYFNLFAPVKEKRLHVKKENVILLQFNIFC